MIIYFSGTGNSKYVAEMLGKQLDEQVVDAGEMIKNEIKGEFESKRPWVFVSPTYAWQLPHIFEKFIKESVFKGSKTAYFVMTCGEDIGNAQVQIMSVCKEINLEYRGVAEIVMPENYIAMFDVPSEEESENIIKKAIPLIEECAYVIKEEGALEGKKIIIKDKVKSAIVNPLFYKLIVKSKKFKVDDKCISYCPTEAIEYGKVSVGKQRYKCRAYRKEEINK